MNQDVLSGLKSALARGSSLKDAMQTFYNAGYKKEEIEEAARALQMEQREQLQKPLLQPQKTKKVKQGGSKQEVNPPEAHVKESFFKKLSKKKLKTPMTKLEEVKKPVEKPTVQKLSESKPKSKRKMIFILLGIVVLILIAGLVGMLLFKEQILDFLKDLL